MKMNTMVQRYIWLNPVVEAMAGADYPALLQQITARGFTVVACSTGVDKVRADYWRCLQANRYKPLIDVRCPLVEQMIEQDYPALRDRMASVLPILMVCASDLYTTYIKNNPYRADLTIVTPCSALAKAGNARFGKAAQFVTWQQFDQEHELHCTLQQIAASPIPPVFFQFPEYRVLEASGEVGVRQILDRIARTPDAADLVELLYCQDGCHNGDGV